MTKYFLMVLGAFIVCNFLDEKLTLIVCIGIATVLILVLNGVDISSMFNAPPPYNELDDEIFDIIVETDEKNITKGDEYQRLKAVQNQIKNNPHGINAYVCAFRDELNPNECWKQYQKRVQDLKNTLSADRARKYAEDPERYRTEYRARLLAQ
jgi:hypothetical protein